MGSIDFIDEVGREWAHASRYRVLEEENAALRKRVEEAELGLARALPIWEEALKLARERAEKAERELDLRKRLMHGLPICGGCMGKHSECQACRADTLQADLAAALVLCVASDWDVEVLGAGYEPEVYKAHAHVLPLLEKRRESRG